MRCAELNDFMHFLTLLNCTLRIRKRKGHQKAGGAVARHLEEATYWILKKGEMYLRAKSKARFCPPQGKRVSSLSVELGN